MQLLKLDRHVGRLSEIAGVLGKYGLAGWLKGLDYDWVHGLFKSSDGVKLSEQSQEARIRMALAELGPTFIKLGQILSTRADLVGPELATELAKLQSDTPADAPDAVVAIIERELGKPPAELFVEFDPTAFASASIGQVHSARTASGQEVVIKVQHEGIEDKVHKDLDILGGLAELAEKHAPDLRPYRPVDTTAEFRRILLAELDFSRERRNLQKFRANFESDETVHIPVPFPDQSSKRVLTMERLDGMSLSKADQLAAAGYDLNEFARRGVNMYLDMVFRDGLYHADPHPGNLLYLPGGVVGLLDCGMVGRIDEQLRDDLEDLLLSIFMQDADQLTEAIVRLDSIPPGFNRDQLSADITEFLSEYGSQSVKDFDLSGALERVTEIVRDHSIILPSNCTMLIKTLVMLEGTARKLSPDFSLGEVMEPYKMQIMKRRFSPQKMFRRAQRTYRDWDRLLSALPGNVDDILGRIRQGSFEVNLQHRSLDTVVNRMVLGLIASALLLGSTLLWALKAPPLIDGVSAFGVVGYAVAAYLGFRLLRAVRQSGDIAPPD